jgi:acyl carrier protein
MNQNLIAENIVLEEVKKAIADTLNIDKGSIAPESSLMTDLGAESLDFLDINYRLEQTFGVKMARHFILEHIEEMFGEGAAIDGNSQLTDKAVSILKIRLGDDFAGIKTGMDMDAVPAMITAQSIAKGIMDILNTLPDNCPSCGKSSWLVENNVRIKCGSCGEYAAFMNGDELVTTWLSKIQEEKKIF